MLLQNLTKLLMLRLISVLIRSMQTRWFAAFVRCRTATAKKVRVAVLAQGEKADEAKAAGADIVGAENLIDSILAGKVDFDRCIATPDMMGLAGRVARVLGRRAMPNPKLGTVTADVATAVQKAKAGEVQYRVEKNGIVHAGIGKASFSEDQIYENAKTFIDAIIKAKPAGAKGTYMKKVTLSSTMGVGVRVDASSL